MNREKLECLSFSRSVWDQERRSRNNSLTHGKTCCEQGLKLDFSSTFHSFLKLFTVTREAGKLEESVYNLAGVIEEAGISQVPTPSYSLPLNRRKDSLSFTIRGVYSQPQFSHCRSSLWRIIILTKISKKWIAIMWIGNKIFERLFSLEFLIFQLKIQFSAAHLAEGLIQIFNQALFQVY